MRANQTRRVKEGRKQWKEQRMGEWERQMYKHPVTWNKQDPAKDRWSINRKKFSPSLPLSLMFLFSNTELIDWPCSALNQLPHSSITIGWQLAKLWPKKTHAQQCAPRAFKERKRLLTEATLTNDKQSSSASFQHLQGLFEPQLLHAIQNVSFWYCFDLAQTNTNT